MCLGAFAHTIASHPSPTLTLCGIPHPLAYLWGVSVCCSPSFLECKLCEGKDVIVSMAESPDRCSAQSGNSVSQPLLTEWTENE